MSISDNINDYNSLKTAVKLLESPSITAKISNIISFPIEGAVKKLPKSVTKKINGAVQVALYKAADVALLSIDNQPNKSASTKLHKLYAATSGALGGAFGFTSLFIELPISTTIMMRAVADVARSEGFDLNDLSTKVACIEVFAIGGNNSKDDTTETGYYLSRSFMTESIRQLSKELAEMAAKQGANKFSPMQTGKWLAKIIEKVASRFGVVITNKFAAQVVPVIGALSGATLNTLFTHFYQDIARGHFIIKRLENQYGYEQVKEEYQKILNKS
ncbi:EcsC family protein [Orbus wheelerorum]|uniref:EcsC family protein n=1 Tax=Orbus wheelerorum TaxID=3074111 RepID=UPI00370CFE43